jgi:ElaB/YqjD/DUF883 family membrane-anchored ribosome-binding protein
MRDPNPNSGPKREPLNRVAQHLDDGAEPEQIKAEIGRTREAMDRTIEQLSDRLRPSRWVEEIIATVLGPSANAGAMRATMQDRAEALGRECIRFARRHPVPSAVLAGGVALLAYEQVKGHPITAEARRAFRRQEDWMDSEHEFERGTTPIAPPRPRGSVTGRPVYGDVGARATGEHAASEYPSGSDYPGDAQESVGERLRERAEDWGERISHRGDRLAHGVSDTLHRGAGAARGVRHAASDAADRVSHSMSDAAHRAALLARSASDRVRYAGDQMSSMASDTAHRVSVGAQRARERTAETVESHPLAVAGALFGVGLLLGVLIPSSRREDRWFGEESDDVKRSARRMGEDVLHRGKEVATATVAAAKEEAQRQGLTPESLVDRVEEVASAASDEAQRRAKEEGLMPSSRSQDRRESTGGNLTEGI